MVIIPFGFFSEKPKNQAPVIVLLGISCHDFQQEKLLFEAVIHASKMKI
jgi:hypothetical protein